MNDNKIENEVGELMNEFKVTENQLTTIVKIALEKNIHLQLSDALRNFVTDCEERLQSECASNYSTLLDSINRISDVRREFEGFKGDISDVTGQIKDVTNQLKGKADKVVNLSNAKKNIQKTKQLLTTCLPALNVYIKLNHEAVHDIRKALEYYKVLEQELIPPIKEFLNFRFIKNITESLPAIKECIMKNARNSVLEFLEKAKAVGQHVGQCVLNHTKFNTGCMETSENYFKEIEGIMDILDFSVLQRYTLVVNEIGVKGNDEQFYKNERLAQVSILSDWANTSKTDVFKNFSDYLLRLIGFFVIEVFVSNNISNTFSKGQLNEIFERCSQSLVYQLETQCELETIGEVSELKRLLSNTHHVMSICGLYSSILKDSEKIIKKKYNDIVTKTAAEKLINFKDVDSLQPLILNNEEEEKALFSLLPLPKSYRGTSYPKTLPFSIYVPTVYIEVMKYIENTLEFNDDRSKGNIELEYDMKISAKHFFSSTVCKNLLSILDFCKSIANYVQIYYDVYFLDSYLPVLDSKISQTSQAWTNNESHSSKHNLKNDQVFKNILHEVENSLLEFVECKIDAYVRDMIFSTRVEHKKKSNRIQLAEKLINFLDAAIEIISRIPSESYTNLSVNMIKHITRSIFSILSDPQTTLTPYAVNTLYECAELMSNFVVNFLKMDSENKTKHKLTSELTQTLTLLAKKDWDYYFNNYDRKDSLYRDVNPKILAVLYTKLSASTRMNLVGTFQNIFRSSSSNTNNSPNNDPILIKLNQLIK